MYISKMHIDAFGILADQGAILSPGINVFLGNNEAGKSTCLKFFRAMLFGYKRRNKSIEPVIPGAGKRLGGGSLSCVTAALGDIVMTRRPGPGPGPLTVLGPGGEALPDGVLSRLLPGLDVEVFDNIFAFTLKDLMDFDSLSGEGVRHALHGAAFGLGGVSPTQLLKSLDNRLRDLLKQGQGAGVINNLVRALEETDNALAAHGASLERYEVLKTSLDEAGVGLDRLQSVRKGLEQERRALERRLNVWPVWEELIVLKAEKGALLARAASLEGSRFTSDSLERLEALLAKKEEQALALAVEEQALARLAVDLENLAVRPELKEMGAPVQALLEQKQAREEEARLVPQLLQQAAALASSQQDILRAFGPGWTRERAFAADCSLFAKDHIRHTQGRQAVLAENARRTKAVFEEIIRERQEVADGLEEAEALMRQNADGPLPPNPEFLRDMNADYARAKAALRELPVFLARQEEAEKELKAALAAVSPAWTPGRLEGVDLSLPGRQAVRQKALDFIAAKAEHQAAWRERALADKEMVKARETATIAAEKLAAHEGLPEAEDLSRRQADLRRMERVWNAREAAARAHAQANELVSDLVAPKEKRSGGWGRAGLIGSALAGAGSLALYLAGFVLGSLYFGPALLFLFAGILLFIVACPFGGGNREEVRDEGVSPLLLARSTAAREEEARGAELKELWEAMAAWNAEAMPGPANLTQAFFDRQRDALDGQARRLILKERDAADLAGAEKQLHEAVVSCERLEAFCMAVQERLERGEAAWQEQLAALDVSRDLAPENCDALFHMISVAESKAAAAQVQARTREEAEALVKNCLEKAVGNEFFRPFVQDAGVLDLAGLERALAEAARLQDQAREVMSRREVMEDRKNRLVVLKKREDEALGQSHQAALALGEEEAAWKAWLKAQGLAETLTPESAAEALALLETYTAKDKERLELAERARSLSQNLGTFVRQAARLALAGGLDLPPDFALAEPQAFKTVPSAQETLPGLPAQSNRKDASMPDQTCRDRGIVLSNLPELLLPRALVLLDTLRREVRQAEEAASLAEEKETQIREREDGVKRAAMALESTRAILDELLVAGKAADPEGFRQAFSLWQGVNGLEGREAALLAHLGNAAKEEGLLEAALAEELEQTSRDVLQERLHALEEELAAAQAEAQAGAEARGQMQAGLDALMNDEEAGNLRSHRAALVEELSWRARQWNELALARHLLLKAKERFEREGQSGVIRHAGECIRDITGGEYVGLSAPLGEDAFFAIHKNGSPMDPEKALSQGTREQIYLALRLAYIRNHADKAEPVPVVMDEVLVNFDPDRMRRTARVLAEFARHNQILFFTCHPGVYEVLLEEAEVVRDMGGPAPAGILVSQGTISSERT